MTSRWRRPDGYAAVELALGAALLLLPVTLLVVTLPGWFERQSAARVAAQQAARAVVLAADWDQGVADARALAAVVAANNGVALVRPVEVSGSLDRGATVVATATVEVPLVVIPVVGEVGGFRWSAQHRERVDDFRSFP